MLTFSGSDNNWVEDVLEIGGAASGWAEKFWEEEVVAEEERIIAEQREKLEANILTYILIGLVGVALIFKTL